MSLLRALGSRPQDRIRLVRHEKGKLLEYIENNTSKNSFVTWLNEQLGSAYSEADAWSKIKTEVVANQKISAGELHAFAASLSSDADVRKLLHDVEEQTSQAQIVADKLSLLSILKRFAVATGGACLLSAVFLLGFAALLWGDVVGFHDLPKLYVFGASLVVGFLQLIAGILLLTE